MKVAYIASGAAGMYCGTCLHDNTLARALMDLGHEVVLVPTYTPTRTDDTNVSLDRVFYGALNVYLQSHSALFRHSPGFLHRWLDHPRLLDWISGWGVSSDAGDLGDLTLSVIQGEAGAQRRELEELIRFLEELAPDVVHLNNAMFLGLAREIRRRLGVPVLCGLTGEDLFLDQLPEPYHSEVLGEIRRRAADVDAFVATSRFYADRMAPYLEVDREKIHVTGLGLHLDDFSASQAPGTSVTGGGADAEPVKIGYLARICPEKGLHQLTDAFIELQKEVELPPVHLLVAGYLARKDRPYLEEIQRRLDGAGLAGRVEVRGEIDREEKLRFLSEIDLLSVPTTYHEPKGLFVLEALAAGVPVVQPDHGAFPELIEATAGGLLVAPGSPQALAAGLRQLIADPALRRQLGQQGRQAVHERYGAPALAEATLAVYRTVSGEPPPPGRQEESSRDSDIQGAPPPARR